MLSCDTMIIPAAFSAPGRNVLAKNSDRPTGEPQPLCYYPAGEYEKGAVVRMTHLTIPQAEKTYAVVGSRPYWLWGFEMGYNEKGLLIGNEAEGSRLPPEEQEGILGMDLLRLALERAATAREGMEVITGLLGQYGQKANASALGQRTYENTFILVDPRECWVLETAGREWAAKQIKAPQGISNCYHIGCDYDILSPGAERTARENRWLSPEEKFDFAKAYSGRLPAQGAGLQRYRRLNQLLAEGGAQDFASLACILRDHYEGELIQPRFGATAGIFKTLCMHPLEWGDSETSASLLAYWDEELGIVGRYAPAQPCLSAYLPVYMSDIPAMLQTGGRIFEEKSLWWQLRKLSLLVAVDETAYAETVRIRLRELEARFAREAERGEAQAREYARAGRTEMAREVLDGVMRRCAGALYDLVRGENHRLEQDILAKGGVYGRQKEVILRYMEYASIPFGQD